MLPADFLSDSPSSSESALPHYYKLPLPDYPQPTTSPFVTATSLQSRWELIKQVLLATFMLVLTVAFVSVSPISVMFFDSYDPSWSWERKAPVWGLFAVIVLIDLVLVCTTIRLFTKISVYSVPLVVLLMVVWVWLI